MLLVKTGSKRRNKQVLCATKIKINLVKNLSRDAKELLIKHNVTSLERFLKMTESKLTLILSSTSDNDIAHQIWELWIKLTQKIASVNKKIKRTKMPVRLNKQDRITLQTFAFFEPILERRKVQEAKQEAVPKAFNLKREKKAGVVRFRQLRTFKYNMAS